MKSLEEQLADLQATVSKGEYPIYTKLEALTAGSPSRISFIPTLIASFFHKSKGS